MVYLLSFLALFFVVEPLPTYTFETYIILLIYLINKV